MLPGLSSTMRVIAVSDWETSRTPSTATSSGPRSSRTAAAPPTALGDTQLNVHGPGVESHEVARDRSRRPGNSDFCIVWPGPIEEAIDHLERHAVEIETGPVTRHGAKGAGTSVYFRDPDGTLLEFIAYA